MHAILHFDLIVRLKLLEQLYGVSTVRIKADFSDGPAVYTDIVDALASKEVGILGVSVAVLGIHRT